MMLDEGTAPPDREVSIKEVRLWKIRLGVHTAIAESLLLDPQVRIDDAIDFIRRRVSVSVSGYLWGKRLEHYDVKYPANWIEAVKERFTPEWFRRRWPVRYERHTIDLTAVWPTVRYMVPGHSPILNLSVFGETVGTYPDDDNKRKGIRTP